MSKPKTPHEFLDTMPGLCGVIAKHIYDQLQWDQPMLAMGAAISFVGFLKSKRFSTHIQIPSHVFCGLIADSGTGKSQCQEAIQNVIYASGLDSCLMGKPKSDSALLYALERDIEARKYLVWDEFGIGLGALSKSTTAHQKMILSTMLDLFSCGNKKYIGDEYAKATKQDRIDLNSPMLTILGASTPDRFYDALSEQFVLDGTLSRFLLFFGADKPEGKSTRVNVLSDSTILKIQEIQRGQQDYEAGDLGTLIRPAVELIEFDSNCHDAIGELSEWCKQKVTNAPDKIERVFNTRLFEQIMKLIIIFSNNSVCSAKEFGYAIALGRFLVKSASDACKLNLFDNQIQKAEGKLRDKILGLFSSVGVTLTRTQIARKYPRDSKLRNQTLRDLCEEEVLQKGLANGSETFTRIA